MGADAPGTLIVLGTVPVCVEQRDKIMSKRTLESSFIFTFLCSFCLVTLLGSFWPSDRRASGQEAAATAVDPWNVNAEVQRVCTVVDQEVGAGQGVTRFGDRLYVYGDLVFARPRVGVIKEFDLELRPTGRSIRLMRQGKPLLIHPTGLTRHEPWGTFLGDTVLQKARIYRLDWEQAWKDRNLDRAVLGEIDDDAAINGTRPVFVSLGGKTYLATADYGDVHPEIRLYDTDRLLAAGRSSAPGVIVHRVLCGPFNQNLHWDESLGHLICIQNVTAGSGWRLDRLDLARGVADGLRSRPGGPGADPHFLAPQRAGRVLANRSGYRALRGRLEGGDPCPGTNPGSNPRASAGGIDGRASESLSSSWQRDKGTSLMCAAQRCWSSVGAIPTRQLGRSSR